MKLKYKILWIENEQDWVESIEDQIQEYLENLGFGFEKKLISKEEKDINYNNYDLILMDLNLANQPNGAELISKIRELGVYTDVVFYSSKGIDELRSKGRENELEGVYYSGRAPEESFIRKVKVVIDSTIKKVQDLNNLRGLVMAEVSELDAIMEDIIQSYYITEERMARLHKHITKNREESIKKTLTHPESEKCDKLCELNWRSMSISEYVKRIDASQKAHAVNEMLKDVNKDGHLGFADGKFFATYKDEIISVRNYLAHCKSVIIDGAEVLKTYKGDITFNAENFKEIRNNIKKYHVLFCKLKNS